MARQDSLPHRIHGRRESALEDASCPFDAKMFSKHFQIQKDGNPGQEALLGDLGFLFTCMFFGIDCQQRPFVLPASLLCLGAWRVGASCGSHAWREGATLIPSREFGSCGRGTHREGEAARSG